MEMGKGWEDNELGSNNKHDFFKVLELILDKCPWAAGSGQEMSRIS